MKTEIRESLENAEARIRSYFNGSGQHVFNQRSLYDLFHREKEGWGIAPWSGPTRFMEFALEKKILREVELKSEDYGTKRRFTTGTPSEFEIGLSLAAGGYLSHATAVFLHALNDQIPKTIYVNREQSHKAGGGESPTQKRIDLAFTGKQRSSRYVFTFDSRRVVLLSGKYTAKLGVVRIPGPKEERLEVTSIARTLVDIAVRPAYAGGIFQVIDAYSNARGRVTGTEIADTLRSLDYVYPYHQSIGFLLERAGYDEHEIEPFRLQNREFDFYLVHGMREKSYDANWRLFYPKGL